MSKADLLEIWRDHLAQSRRRSEHTVRAYLACANRLLEALEIEDWPQVAKLEAPDLRRHLANRRMEGVANTTAARELSALKNFIGFAREQVGHGRPVSAAPARSADQEGLAPPRHSR